MYSTVNMLPEDLINRIKISAREIEVEEHRKKFWDTLDLIKYMIVRHPFDWAHEDPKGNNCCKGGDIGWTCWTFKTIGAEPFNTYRWNDNATTYCHKHGNYFSRHR